MKTLGMFLGSMIVAAVIAIGAAVIVVGLTCDVAHAQDYSTSATSVAKTMWQGTQLPSYYKLLDEESEAMFNLKFERGIERFGLALRGPKAGPSNLSAKSLSGLKVLPVSNYVDPYLGWEKLVSVTHRNVVTIYYNYIALFAPFTEQQDIVEIMPNGEAKLICTLFIRHEIADGMYYTAQTELQYTDDDGFQIRLTVGGEIDWEAFYRSISVADGVYYGKPGKIMKVKNEYNANGDRLFGIMKVTYFDSLGSIIREELTKERSWYNRDGNLIKTSTAFSVDGKLVRVSSLNRIYIGKVLLMETNDTISYNEDGTIASSTLERSWFDAKGRETQYQSVEYRGSIKVSTIDRKTVYNGEGTITRYEYKYRSYYDNGQMGQEQNELTTFNDQTGDYLHSASWTSYDQDGNVTYSYRNENEERYNSDGRLVYKRYFTTNAIRPGWGPFQGQLTTTYEEERITESEYDGNGNLIKEHEYGYWFSTAIDPWFDRLTTFVYHLWSDGTKAIQNKHVSRVEATDSAFENLTYRYDENIDYRYAPTVTLEYPPAPQPLIAMKRTVTEERWDTNEWNIRSYEKFVTVDSESYDADTGKITQKRHFYQEQVLPRWGPLAGVLTVTYEEERIIDYTYDAEGDLVNEHEHGYWFSTYIDPFFDKLTTWLYNIMPDGVKKLVNKHIVLKEAQDADYVNMTHDYVEDTVYTYDSDTGKLASVHTTISDTYYYDWGMWNRESTIEELYENGNLMVRSEITDYNNGESGYMELLTYTRYEDGTVETEVRHTEWQYQGVPTSATDEIKVYNRQGKLTLHTIRSDNSEYTETRSYHENGNLASVDIVSYNDGRWYMIDGPIYKEYDPIDRIDKIRTLNYTDEIAVDMFIRRPGPRQGNYELHETYREDGLITHREEKSEYDNGWWGPWYVYGTTNYETLYSYSEKVGYCMPPWYSSKTSTSLTENWEYSTGGTLLHYKKEYSSETSNNYDWDGLWARGGVYKETVERFYGQDGKILEEKYEKSGNNGYVTIYDGGVIFEKVDLLKIRPLDEKGAVPQDPSAFVYAVIDNFYNNGIYKNATQKMNILYHYGDDGSLGSVQINWQDQASDGSILYGFLCTITIEDGKIMALVVSETGERNNFWEIPVFDIISPYIKYADGSQPVTNPAVPVQYVENQDTEQGGGGAPQLIAQKACDELVSEFDMRMEIAERNMKQRTKYYSPNRASGATYSTQNR